MLRKELRKARIKRGWNQQHLAFHLGVCTNTVSRIERGIGIPTHETEEKIRAWLGAPGYVGSNRAGKA
jgi:transcriptional regulator with XRE-family HTH domain